MTDNVQLTPEQIEKLKAYKQEAFNALTAEARAKAEFKDIVAVLSDTTALEKRTVAKLFKSIYNAKIDEVLGEAETLSHLNELIGG